MSNHGELLLAELAKHEAGTCCCKHEPTFTTKCVIGALHPNGTSDLGIRDLRDRIAALERELAEARDEVERLRGAIQATLHSPYRMGGDDIDRLVAALDAAAWSRYQQEREGGEGR